MTCHLNMHANTHIYNPSDKPNYDPITRLTARRVCRCVYVSVKTKAHAAKETFRYTKGSPTVSRCNIKKYLKLHAETDIMVIFVNKS